MDIFKTDKITGSFANCKLSEKQRALTSGSALFKKTLPLLNGSQFLFKSFCINSAGNTCAVSKEYGRRAGYF